MKKEREKKKEVLECCSIYLRSVPLSKLTQIDIYVVNFMVFFILMSIFTEAT